MNPSDMEDKMRKDFGKGVRVAMARKGLTSTDLSKTMNVSMQTVANWRNGRGLRLEVLEEIAEKCDLTFDDLSEYSTVEEAKAGS
jgi:transcriptional regulator with XRE-family HTH domain